MLNSSHQPFYHHLRIDFSQLSIILTSYVFIVSSRRAQCVVIQVTGAFCGGSAANRGGKENHCGGRMSGRQRGIAGGKNNYQPGASGLVKKPLSCTVCRKCSVSSSEIGSPKFIHWAIFRVEFRRPNQCLVAFGDYATGRFQHCC